MSHYNSNRAPPPFADLAEANREIRRLQQQLFTYNQRLASMAEKAELTKRSLKGTIIQLEAQIRALKGVNT